MNDEICEWFDCFMKEIGVCLIMVYVGVYFSIMQYLKVIEVIGFDDVQIVCKQMMEIFINDMFVKNGQICEDGCMVYDMFLVEVKIFVEFKSEWDLYKILCIILVDEVYCLFFESKCLLVISK